MISGTPTFGFSEHGQTMKCWEGQSLIDKTRSTPADATLCIFKCNNPAVDGVIIGAADGTTSTQMRVVSSKLQFRPPTGGTANIEGTTTLVAGQSYVAFGYCTGLLTTERHIWINGANVDGTTSSNNLQSAISRVLIGRNGFSAAVVPDCELIMAAIWKGFYFDEAFARFISNNPWSVFDGRKLLHPVLSSTSTSNLFRGNFAKMLGGKL